MIRSNSVTSNNSDKNIQFINHQGGYDPKIFTTSINSDFMCPLCNFIVRKPKECVVCGNIFCDICIKNWAEKHFENQNQNIITECPLKCKSTSNFKESILKPIGKVIKNILIQFEVKCPNQNCGSFMSLEKYEDHEYYCFLPKCNNYLCGKGSEKQVFYKSDLSEEEKKFCTDLCKFSFVYQQSLLKKSKDEMCLWFNNFVKGTLNENLHKDCQKRISNLKSMIKAVSGNTMIQINDSEYSSGITSFTWDNVKKGQGIQVYNNGESLLLNETCYAFRTIVSNTPFNSGVHYWEIIADRRTENELKIGITKNIMINFDTVS